MDRNMIPSDPPGLRPMSPDRFRRLVDSYGSEVERWPESERPAAWALLALSAEAKEACRDAAPLDETLRTVTPPDPSEPLAARLRDLPLPSDNAKRNNSKRGRWLTSHWLAWPVAVAATAMLFFVLGWSAPGLWESRVQTSTEPPRLALLDEITSLDGEGLDAGPVGDLLDDSTSYGDDTLEFAEFEPDGTGEITYSEGDFLAALPLY